MNKCKWVLIHIIILLSSIIMENQLKRLEELYYDPETGYVNVNELIKKAHKAKLFKLTTKSIKDWYKSQSVNQVYHKDTSKTKWIPIYSPWRGVGCIQADLMFAEKFKRHNKKKGESSSYSYILAVIDVYSRYAWAFPLMRKSASEVVKHIKKVIKAVKSKHPKGITFTSDYGGEFMGKVKECLISENVTQFLLNPNDDKSLQKKGIIERFNRTLWNKMKKYMSANNTLKYYDVLPKLISNYNNSVHSSTGETPYDIFNKNRIKRISRKSVTLTQFKIGGKVRIKLKDKTFDKKSFEPRYSTKIFEIIDKRGERYYLKELKTNNKLKYTYLARQLLNANRAERQKSNGKTMKINNRKNRRLRRMRREFGGDMIDEDGDVIIKENMIPEDADPLQNREFVRARKKINILKTV